MVRPHCDETGYEVKIYKHDQLFQPLCVFKTQNPLIFFFFLFFKLKCRRSRESIVSSWPKHIEQSIWDRGEYGTAASYQTHLTIVPNTRISNI